MVWARAGTHGYLYNIFTFSNGIACPNCILLRVLCCGALIPLRPSVSAPFLLVTYFTLSTKILPHLATTLRAYYFTLLIVTCTTAALLLSFDLPRLQLPR